MARKFEMEAFIDSALRHVEADIRSSWKCLQRGESPIEQLLFASLFIRSKLDTAIVGGMALVLPGREDLPIPEDWIAVYPQHSLLDWPIDFFVEVRGIDSRIRGRLAIECDGHEFHERTKEQASRDRSRDRQLQAAGVTVFRFTGSEIYRDPWKCASQILEWAERVVVGCDD